MMVMDQPGIVCLDCDQPLPVGAPYSQRLVGWLDAINDVVCEVICVYCALPDGLT